jgi:hypothetical protein
MNVLTILAFAAMAFSCNAFAQSELEGCGPDGRDGLTCPNGMQCRKSAELERLECNTGLQCAPNPDRTVLRCNTGSVYSIKDATLIVPPSRLARIFHPPP